MTATLHLPATLRRLHLPTGHRPHPRRRRRHLDPVDPAERSGR